MSLKNEPLEAKTAQRTETSIFPGLDFFFIDKSVLFWEREFSEIQSNHQGLNIGFIRLFPRTDEPILIYS